MQPEDPTIPNRLILRALIEDGLPSRARHERWPVCEPADFARAIFDSVCGCPYEQEVSEPVFEYLTKAQLKKALKFGLDIQNSGLSALQPLLSKSKTLRSADCVKGGKR